MGQYICGALVENFLHLSCVKFNAVAEISSLSLPNRAEAMICNTGRRTDACAQSHTALQIIRSDNKGL